MDSPPFVPGLTTPLAAPLANQIENTLPGVTTAELTPGGNVMSRDPGLPSAPVIKVDTGNAIKGAPDKRNWLPSGKQVMIGLVVLGLVYFLFIRKPDSP